MSSKPHGTNTSAVEVTNVSAHGFWVLYEQRELYLPFEDFPWFRDASIKEISEVQEPYPGHLRWPTLDVDLAVASIEHPERFPLKSRGDG